MKTSTPCTDLLTSLCAARLEFPAITRNRDGHSKRTGQKYKYADLNALIDSTEPVLLAHGLLLVQSLEDGEGGTLRMTSTLFHASSGQWMTSDVSVEKPDDMQNFGMTCTYLKRYAQQAILNISTEEDDDAASLNGSSKAEISAAVGNRRATEPVNGNGHTPAPEPDKDLAHPTEGHIAALANLALTECHEDKEVYYQRIRQTMGLKPQASVAPRLLTRTMSMAQYMTVYAYYVKLSEQLDRATRQETAHGAPSAQNPVSEPTQTTAAESHPVDPPSAAGSMSAPEVSTEPVDTVESLVAAAISWGLKEDVTRRVITLHKDLAKCRRILLDASERNKRQVA